ncbi:1624_t:CDS:1, partial [Acaulospora colombiana]
LNSYHRRVSVEQAHLGLSTRTKSLHSIMSGNSTPLSQVSTLVNWQDVKELTLNKSSETILPASAVLEYYSSKSSSAVFLYDVAREAGFGTTLRELSKSQDGGHYAKVFELQSRTGAGLSLLGRLSEGTSSDGSHSSTALTAYTTPSGLALMAPTLALCPPPSTNGRLVIQVPSITHVGSDMSVSPTLSQLTSFFTSSPEHFAVILSATPQEVVDFAAVSYATPKSHIVHIFDHWSAARETSKKRAPTLPLQAPVSDIHTALHKLGHSFFEYAGDSNATNVVLVLNGPLALSIKHLASVIPSFGVVIVKVLRPWDENALRKAIPTSTTSLYVIDDVISSRSFTPLYHDTLGLLAHASPKTPKILSHKLDTLTLGQLLASGQSLVGYLSSIISLDWFAPPKIPTLEGKKVTFYSSPSSPLHEAPATTSQLFLNHPSIDAHYIQNFDAFSKPGGVIQSNLLLNVAPATTYSPPALFHRGQGPETDALVILDASLLKTHDILSELKEGAPVLITTSWTVEELIANMSVLNLETAILKKPQVLIIDIEKVANDLNASESAIAITTSAFLRLYLGSIATPELITNLSTPFFGKEVSGVETRQISKASWDALSSVPLPTEVPTEEKITPLKQFQFNSIVPDAPAPPKAITAQASLWTEAAKQIVFKEAFSPALPQVKGTQYPRNPALRPDVPEETYLVTCTVNRRLTPLEYNRNVFHLEFDTRGTGLKYEIGEALGVHGWNDADEVLHFCSWYGLNPKDVISIPLPGDSSKRHVRTIFQAFQQQIDLFGKPPKSFYEALS